MSAKLTILHLHSGLGCSSGAGPVVPLINGYGRACRHRFVSALALGLDVPAGIERGIAAEPARDFPPLQGRPTPARLQRLAKAMLGHDLVLTYGYGAIDAAMAHTMLRSHLALPPLVHHESDDLDRLQKRNWYRRIALGRTAALVVPSRQLESFAMASWHQPRWRVQRIPDGIPTAAYAVKPRRDALPRVIKRPGELWLGTLADLARANDHLRLVRCFAALPEPWQLVILGEGPERDAIRDEALRRDLGHRVHLPGAVAEPARVLGLFDLFALSAETAAVPAMAAGLAIVAADASDIAATLAAENRPFVAAADDEFGFVAALRTLAETPALRATVGAANRALARTEYDEAVMIAAYRGVYARALGRTRFP